MKELIKSEHNKKLIDIYQNYFDEIKIKKKIMLDYYKILQNKKNKKIFIKNTLIKEINIMRDIMQYMIKLSLLIIKL